VGESHGKLQILYEASWSIFICHQTLTLAHLLNLRSKLSGYSGNDALSRAIAMFVNMP